MRMRFRPVSPFTSATRHAHIRTPGGGRCFVVGFVESRVSRSCEHLSPRSRGSSRCLRRGTAASWSRRTAPGHQSSSTTSTATENATRGLRACARHEDACVCRAPGTHACVQRCTGGTLWCALCAHATRMRTWTLTQPDVLQRRRPWWRSGTIPAGRRRRSMHAWLARCGWRR